MRYTYLSAFGFEIKGGRNLPAIMKAPRSAFFLSSFLCLSMLPAEVVINEIMFNVPRGENLPEPVAEEFIEIHNSGEADISLDGWKFDAGVSFDFPTITIPAGGFMVVSADPAAFAVKYPEVTAAVVGP